jgi:taurine transport system ATP-binding protein
MDMALGADIAIEPDKFTRRDRAIKAGAAPRRISGQGARLTTDGLGVVFPTRGGPMTAIADVAFDLPAGDFLSVIGPSGCGKTTLLNVIAGFIRPGVGRVLVDGKAVSGPGPDRAVVHQQTAALLPWLSVRDNVGLALRARGVSRSQSREIVAHYLALVRLSDFGRHAIYEISGGMQQRVALARALAAESPVVLLDEPLGALDALQRQLMQDFLLDIWGKTRRTFLLITHSIDEAVYLSSEVLVMSPRPGRIVARERFSFGERALDGGGAAVKATAEFAGASARLLDLLMSPSIASKEGKP